MIIKAIETQYAGCRFRSRTEARWAVFFGHMGWSWEFEPEGFETPSGRYLPDFRLHAPGGDRWFEVKPYTGPEMPDETRWAHVARSTGLPLQTAYGMHRRGDTCPSSHGGRLVLPGGESFTLGHFWSEHAAAFDAASSARFEFGENG
jgi:hypothetical protein